MFVFSNLSTDSLQADVLLQEEHFLIHYSCFKFVQEHEQVDARHLLQGREERKRYIFFYPTPTSTVVFMNYRQQAVVVDQQ